MEVKPAAGDNFRYPEPYESRLATTGVPCKTSVVSDDSLVSAGALNSGGALNSVGVPSTEFIESVQLVFKTSVFVCV